MAGPPAVTGPGPAVPGLSRRDRQAELMDDPELSAERHASALDALARVNAVSLVAGRVVREVRRLPYAPGPPARVLDVACGGGDVLASLHRAARRAGTPVELIGCDRSEFALERTRTLCPGVTAHHVDVLDDPLPPADLVICNLFLHHLERDEAVSLLRRMAEATASTLLVQDLRRTRLGYALAWLGLHALTRSDVARIDGLRSVRSAFTVDEARGLAADAGLVGATVKTVWPQRFLLRWERTPR